MAADTKLATVKLVAFAGSLRQGSHNHQLVEFAAAAARRAGAQVTVVRLRELELPLLDQDLEDAHGLPAGAKRLKQLLIEADGMLIASPEYNGSLSAALKNAIDWCTRTERPDEPALRAFKGKTAALLAASPGALGGIRGLTHLRTILAGIGVFVLPDQKGVPAADKAFDADGQPRDAALAKAVTAIAERLVETCRRLRS
jgi:chromate reductase